MSEFEQGFQEELEKIAAKFKLKKLKLKKLKIKAPKGESKSPLSKLKSPPKRGSGDFYVGK